MKLSIFWTIFAAFSFGFISQQSMAEENGEGHQIVDSKLLLESIECRGNKNIPCDFIRQKLRLPVNHEIVDAQVQNAKLRLSALSNFKSVDVHLEKGSEKGKAILIVEVTEASSLLTEIVAGAGYTSSAQGKYLPSTDAQYQSIAGRISYQNLFNHQKIVELTASHLNYDERFLSAKENFSRSSAKLTYIDPNLFAWDRMFMSLNVNYEHLSSNAYSSQLFKSDSTTEDLLSDLQVGVRLWKQSYLFAGFSHEVVDEEWNFHDIDNPPNSNSASRHYRNDGEYAGVGWDSEDDPYFPTKGFVVTGTASWQQPDPATPVAVNCVDCDVFNWSLAYKQHWAINERSVLTLKLGGNPIGASYRIQPVQTFSNEPSLSLSYARSLRGGDIESGRRGRWYVQVGTGPYELSRDGHTGGQPNFASLMVGVRFESKYFGIVDLFATGSRYWPR